MKKIVAVPHNVFEELADMIHKEYKEQHPDKKEEKKKNE